MDRDDLRHRYLHNPFFKMDAKTAKQLGVGDTDTQDVAYEVSEPELAIDQQVIVRKVTRGRSKKTTADNTANDSTLQK